MARQLRDNRDTNPYYEVMHNFFNRQRTLRGNQYFLSKSIKTDVMFLGNRVVARHPRTNEVIFFPESFRIDEGNKEESLRYLINYFTLSIIAQSFEAFESFVKDIYRKSVSLQIANVAVATIAMRNVRSLKNAEVLKLLQAICPPLDGIFSNANVSWIYAMEKLRHRIVHNDQLIDTETMNSLRSDKYLENSFEFTQVEAKNYRAYTVGEATRDILNNFQELAFSTFVLVCEHEGYPVEISK